MRVQLLPLAATAAFLLAAAALPAPAAAQTMTPTPQYPQGTSPYGQPPGAPPPRQTAPLWGTPQPLPPPPQPPASAMAPNGEYVAPLSQTTQPSYVPQSVALSGPRFIKDWEEGQPIPYGYHAETRVRKGPIIAGSVLFGVTYLYSAFIASIGQDVSDNGNNKVASLYIPVFGPFAEMFQTSSATADYLLVLDGAAQAAGMAMLICGATMPKALLVRNDLAMMTVVPMKLGHDGSGFGLVGRF